MDEHSFRLFWIRTNVSFLGRYWITASEALERVKSAPDSYREFQVNEGHEGYVTAVLSSHMEHHCYSGVLLAYATMDEFLAFLTRDLGKLLSVGIGPSDLKDRGIKRYRKFIEQVCSVKPDQINIDWTFLEDFSVIRNAIIHANGNAALLKDRRRLEAIVTKYKDELSFKHSTKMVIRDVFVERCIAKTLESAMNLSKYLSSKDISKTS